MGYNTIPKNPWPLSSEQAGGSGETYTLPIASDETLGGVMVGDGLSINAETGELSNDNPTPYELPIANDETLGGIMVGDGLSINAETGALSANRQIVDYSTTEQNTGQKWIDGKDIYFKVVSLGNLPNNGVKNVSAGILGASVIKLEGYYNTGTTVSNLFNIVALTNFVYNATSDEVIVNVTSDLSSVTAIAILYYTKATT